MNQDYHIQCNLASFMLIQNDCESIKALLLNLRELIVSMGIVPYVALFYRSYQDYFNERLVDQSVDKLIIDIRNNLKVYSHKYNKIKHQFGGTDTEQDAVFRDACKFKFLETLNWYYNLGIYFYDGHIISNTQLIANSLNVPEFNQEIGKRNYQISFNLASAIRVASENMGKQLKPHPISFRPTDHKFMYVDINSNKNTVFNPELDKDGNLLLLHILSEMSFIKYVIAPMYDDKNLWTFRLKYITLHSAFQGMRSLYNHLANTSSPPADFINSLQAVLAGKDFLFTSQFRNCMMHYDLLYNNTPNIEPEKFDAAVPLFGLVESIYPEYTFERLNSLLDDTQLQFEQVVGQVFNINTLTLKPF